MMRMAATLGLLLVCGAGFARAQETAVPAADQAAETEVIRRQMDAFRRDDAAAAFGYAAPAIQSQFGADPEVFMAMVRRGYQAVYRPRSTAFGQAELKDGKVVQHVQVVGPEGRGHEALYFMEHEPDGSWRIAGCVLTDSADVGA